MAWLEEKRAVVFGALIALSLLGGFLFYSRQSKAPPLEISTPEPTFTPTLIVQMETPTPEPTSTPRPLRVYISGEVNAPDVYILLPGSIIKDIILAAGGATVKADLDIVNQAEALKDQQHIHIPAKIEARPTPPVVTGGQDPQAPLEADTQSGSQRTASLASQKININTATVMELELLPGIGPAIAKRIVDHREASGNFTAIEDITNVKGIGPATFEKLKEYITVD